VFYYPLKKMLIGIIGNKYTGKDTFADYLVKHYEFKKITYAEPLKEISRYLFHLQEEQLSDPYHKEIKIPYWDLTPREIFQRIGTDLFRNHFDKDFWIKQFEIRFLKDMDKKEKTTNMVCSDVRFQNEADLIKKYGGILVRVDRPNLEKKDSHESEKLEIVGHDYYIENSSSLQDFYDKIDGLVENF